MDPFATPAGRSISSFDGLRSQSCYKIDLHLDSSPDTSQFIITSLKDTYNGILGMPWIRQHGHQIDWKEHRVVDEDPTIAVAKATLSSLLKPQITGKLDSPPSLIKTCQDGCPPLEDSARHSKATDTAHVAVTEATSSLPPDPQDGPLGTARMNDEGVCVLDMLAPPQRKHDSVVANYSFEIAGKQYPPVTLDETRLLGTAGRETNGPIATAAAVSPIPEDTSSRGKEPRRTARINGEGVCVDNALALPRCESNTLHPHPAHESAGELLDLAEQTDPLKIAAAKALWSKSAQLAADARTAVAQQLLKDLVPRAYHQFLAMFRKRGSQSLPPIENMTSALS
ncbi:hypothetical protein PCASD_10593 [Puccinia coronata f. sp. avenae]|uniref:Uncharacterized protein n=1 Tax=Puccinia coronata f. sp. avenae TaxID=200324 RepID=A0A2N5U9E8_9BASI|nr:hypothetical protein PCASD_10593 [Puccinia coronata f. sp. avenae]